MKKKGFFDEIKKFSLFHIFSFTPKVQSYHVIPEIKNTKIKKLNDQLHIQEYTFPNEPILIIKDHYTKILDIAFSPDGLALASISEDNRILIHNVDPKSKNFGKMLTFYHLTCKATKIVFSKCGNFISFASEDKGVYVLIIDAKKENIKYLTLAISFKSMCVALTFSYCLNLLAISGGEECAILQQINNKWNKIEVLKEEKGVTGEIVSMAFNNNTSYIVTAGEKNRITIYKIVLENEIYSFIKLAVIFGQEYLIECLNFSPCGTTLAISGYDLVAMIQDFDYQMNKVYSISTIMPIKNDDDYYEDNEDNIVDKNDRFIMLGNEISVEKFKNDQWILSQSISNDGNLLVTGSSEGKLQYFCINNKFPEYGTVKYQVGGISKMKPFIRALNYCPGRNYLAIGTDNSQIYLFA